MSMYVLPCMAFGPIGLVASGHALHVTHLLLLADALDVLPGRHIWLCADLSKCSSAM